jgi:hypothetical protein
VLVHGCTDYHWLKHDCSLQTVDAIPAGPTAAQMLAQPPSAKANAATSRMDFDAVCRTLF